LKETVTGNLLKITEFASFPSNPLGFVGALAMSSDTFFYQIGRGTGGVS